MELMGIHKKPFPTQKSSPLRRVRGAHKNSSIQTAIGAYKSQVPFKPVQSEAPGGI